MAEKRYTSLRLFLAGPWPVGAYYAGFALVATSIVMLLAEGETSSLAVWIAAAAGSALSLLVATALSPFADDLLTWLLKVSRHGDITIGDRVVVLAPKHRGVRGVVIAKFRNGPAYYVIADGTGDCEKSYYCSYREIMRE